MASSSVARAYTILEAVRLAVESDIPALRRLLLCHTLKLDHVLRILLTFLPEATDPESYVELLRDLANAPPEIPRSTQQYPQLDLSEREACDRVRRLRLLPLTTSQLTEGMNDPFSLFLVKRAHRIDAVTGSLDAVVKLLRPFAGHSPFLQTWMVSTLLPLLRLQYEYYPASPSPISLMRFEQLEGKLAVQTLLAEAARKKTSESRAEVGRDLRGLIGPWMYGESARKRRKLQNVRDGAGISARPTHENHSTLSDHEEDTSWSYVNEWLTELAIRDFPRAVDAFAGWGGPGDVDYGDWQQITEVANDDTSQAATRHYVQAGLAVTYTTDLSSIETLVGSHRILMKAVVLTGLDEPPDLKRSDVAIRTGISSDFFHSIEQTHMLLDHLSQSENPLTRPSQQSLALYNMVLASCFKLLHLGNPMAARDAAALTLFGTDSQQHVELKRTLYKLKEGKLDDKGWTSVRQQLLWLRNWEDSSGPAMYDTRGVFSKIPINSFETDLLCAMLDGGSYDLAFNIYCKMKDPPLPLEVVEATVLNAAMASYDAASNGNRTRGGVRKASDIVFTFRERLAGSKSFVEMGALLSATHAMSFYSLSLQYNVPFRPVNIRAHEDPMSLIGKILAQNPRSYTHLDDLLQIGSDLVTAGLASKTRGDQSCEPGEDVPAIETTVAKRRITRMAIEAALAEDDFDTAYSYVVNRLDATKSTDAHESPLDRDDISWRAAYAAGRYPSSTSNRSSLRRLEQRLELLSQALLLAPAPALIDILPMWQQCEQQMTHLLASEADKEDIMEKQGAQRIPGGFVAESSPAMQQARDPTRGALQEEAPMGLFEVARGAASALSKNAFPLRAPHKSGSATVAQSRPLSSGSREGSDSDGGRSGLENANRVRKRDMVSNMVTGGLASGIGWVIGAPAPVRSE